MAKTVPAEPTLPSALDGASLKIATGRQWRNVVRTQNYAFAHTGARVPGPYFSNFATTTSTTYTQVNSTAGDEDLDTWFPTSQLLRLLTNGLADVVDIELQIFGFQVDAKLTIVELDTNTDLLTLTTSQSGSTSAWATNSTNTSWASTFEGDSTANAKRNLAYKMEFRATSATANLLTWCVHEKHAIASELPPTP
jgi:hypothetical protein